MKAQAQPTPFRILWRAFLEQFVANESATSDLQTRRAILGILAFLITPGFLLMMQTMPTYELTVLVAKARNMPELVERALDQLAVLFVVYSMATTGLVTVFVWDVLVFDKRDAMVLGPLPISGSTVVAAKLAALATLLLGTALAVNLVSGLPFAFVTGSPAGRIGAHLTGHLAGTIGGAIFMFATIVVVRGLVVLLAGPNAAAAVGSMLQFCLISAVLLFVMTPALISSARQNVLFLGAGDWMPTRWFIAVFEYIRGSVDPRLPRLAVRAAIAVPLAIAAVVVTMLAGYRRQLSRALAPPAKAFASAAIRRRIAALIAGRDHVARGVSEFVLTTLARSRPQQMPIVMAASIAVAIISVAISTRQGGLAELQTPRIVVLWIPIVIGYWIVVGLRAAFVVPAELPAAVIFRAHARLPSPSFWLGVRAAMIAFALPPALFANVVTVGPLAGWQTAAWHSLVVCLMVVIAADGASLLTRSVPFTQAYPPGHAKLKTRWPLYLLGMFAIAYFPVQAELRFRDDPTSLAVAAGACVVIIAGLEIAGRRLSRHWTVEADDDAGDPESPTTLDIGMSRGSLA